MDQSRVPRRSEADSLREELGKMKPAARTETLEQLFERALFDWKKLGEKAPRALEWEGAEFTGSTLPAGYAVSEAQFSDLAAQELKAMTQGYPKENAFWEMEHLIPVDGTGVREVTEDPEFLKWTNQYGYFTHRGYRVFLFDQFALSRQDQDHHLEQQAGLIESLVRWIQFPPEEAARCMDLLLRIRRSHRLLFWISPDGFLTAFREDVAHPFRPMSNAGVVVEQGFRNPEVFVQSLELPVRPGESSIADYQRNRVRVTIGPNFLTFAIPQRSELRSSKSDVGSSKSEAQNPGFSSNVQLPPSHSASRSESRVPKPAGTPTAEIRPDQEISDDLIKSALERMKELSGFDELSFRRAISFKDRAQCFWAGGATKPGVYWDQKAELSYFALPLGLKAKLEKTGENVSKDIVAVALVMTAGDFKARGEKAKDTRAENAEARESGRLLALKLLARMSPARWEALREVLHYPEIPAMLHRHPSAFASLRFLQARACRRQGRTYSQDRPSARRACFGPSFSSYRPFADVASATG